MSEGTLNSLHVFDIKWNSWISSDSRFNGAYINLSTSSLSNIYIFYYRSVTLEYTVLHYKVKEVCWRNPDELNSFWKDLKLSI